MGETAGGGWLATHEDIIERQRAEEQIAHMARHDALTDLPNRLLLRERLEHELKRVKRGECLAVLCLDLDHFRRVNDTLGHPIGDELLKAVADRLRHCTRETDTIARLGGDEFAIIMTAMGEPTDAAALSRRVRFFFGMTKSCAVFPPLRTMKRTVEPPGTERRDNANEKSRMSTRTV